MLVTNPYNLLGREEAQSGKAMRTLDPNMTDDDYNEYKKGYITVKAIMDLNCENIRDHEFCNSLLFESDKELYHSIHDHLHHQD